MAYADVEALARALRVRVTAENTADLQSKLDAAAAEIDQYLDRGDVALPEPAPAAVIEANVLLGVDLYKGADAAFGVIGFDQIGAIRVSSDALGRVVALLIPYKLGWGIA
jgi:hypothetical protein